jgi:hypothetical protein
MSEKVTIEGAFYKVEEALFKVNENGLKKQCIGRRQL